MFQVLCFKCSQTAEHANIQNMDENETSGTHPLLLEAQRNARYIEKHGFDDFGAKTAEIRVKQIVEGLKSKDELKRAEALELIKRFENEWLMRDGAGTAGSILTRLIGLGIIEDFPKREIEADFTLK
jgi:hypothetical protein